MTSPRFRLAELAQQIFEKKGASVQPATCHRWCSRGVRGIVLAHESVGGVIYVSWDDYLKFSSQIREAMTKSDMQIAEYKRQKPQR